MTGALNSEVIRLAAATDLDALFDLNESSFPEAWSKEALGNALAEGFVVYVWPDKTGKLAAYFLGQIVLDELHILQLAVATTFRRRRVGFELVSHVLKLMRKQGVNKAELEVRSTNVAAIGLYRALGFDVKGRRPNYYSASVPGNSREDAVLMSCHLKLK